MKVILIGAGLANLTYGALAAQNGHEVTIYEKNNVPGGVVALCEHNGYKFEQGPLLISDMLEQEPVYELLKSLGISLKTIRADRDIAFKDFELIRPQEYKGPYWRKEYLKTIFPEDSKGLDKYYKFYDNVMELRYLMSSKDNMVNKLKKAAIFLKIKKYSKMNVDELTKHFFTNEKLRLVYTGILADFCVEPEEAMGLLTVFTNFETAFDERIPLYKNNKKYYPGFCFIEGGVQKIPEALADYITSHSGNIVYNSVVSKVIIENNKAIGIKLENGKEDYADIIVGCGSGKDFFKYLVGHENLSEQYLDVVNSYKTMESVFMIHLGVNIDPMNYLRSPLIYYYGMYDLKKATENLRNGVYHEGDDGFLIFVDSYHAKDFAPEGKHALTIYTVAPDSLKEGSWNDKKQEYADKLIKLAESFIPGLSESIEEMKIMTPEDYRHLTHMSKSSFGGNVPIWNQKAPSHFTSVENLLFLGQQSENNGGMAAVILGAKDAYEKTKMI